MNPFDHHAPDLTSRWNRRRRIFQQAIDDSNPIRHGEDKYTELEGRTIYYHMNIPVSISVRCIVSRLSFAVNLVSWVRARAGFNSQQGHTTWGAKFFQLSPLLHILKALITFTCLGQKTAGISFKTIPTKPTKPTPHIQENKTGPSTTRHLNKRAVHHYLSCSPEGSPEKEIMLTLKPSRESNDAKQAPSTQTPKRSREFTGCANAATGRLKRRDDPSAGFVSSR